ncbi:hypothetical protein BJX68DRAFT_270068 [Aspergillus pseudodeflectus]|uniref:Small secreted protein n=1 Tax=Aspergillus pseudodeflectus TaxID=176178 RepID=A0ABR4JU62_9EURO
MKFPNAFLPLSLSLLASTTLAVSVTQIQKGGTETELSIATDGVCVDLFQGTYGAVLNDGANGTACVFWVDSGCSGPSIGTATTCKPEVELPEGANGIRCFAPGTE